MLFCPLKPNLYLEIIHYSELTLNISLFFFSQAQILHRIKNIAAFLKRPLNILLHLHYIFSAYSLNFNFILKYDIGNIVQFT